MKQETRNNKQETKILKARVAVGLSGGVDSAVSAALLQEQGYEVTGVFLMCWKEPGCRTDEDRKDALSVALRLRIPFQVLDFRKEYKKRVVDYFYREYRAGRTPNPDTMCNREIKFGLFYDWALRLRSGSSTLSRTTPQGLRFDYVATGHYARVQNGKLLRGVDEKKDQSYFLYQLKKDQLEHILFPVGHLKKEVVRMMARKWGLPVATKPDSQGICFIGDVDVQELLRERLKERTGKVVDTDGTVIGKHDGVWFYTIGQRHGFTINGKWRMANGAWRHAIPPLYVITKDVERNRLVVGFGAETYTNQFKVDDLNWLSSKFKVQSSKFTNGIWTRIRHGGQLISSKFKVQSSKLTIRLDEPQRGVAPGQAAVFYGKDDEVLGGGVIS